MSHHVYNTRGFVLSSSPLREADKFFSILTPDLGLVRATARGVRGERSRLRSILGDQNFIDVSLVRGKHDWRLTTASLKSDLVSFLKGSRAHLQALSRVSSLITKLVRGEEKHEGLFQTVEESLFLLSLEVDPTLWEIYTVSHLLYHLGYLEHKFVPANMMVTKDEKKNLVLEINRGLKESGLS